jgi:hypothetical protein
MPICLSLNADETVTPGDFTQALLLALLTVYSYDVDEGDATALNVKAEESRMWS